ncbi:Peptidyl-prolyl cis-trans isomerase D [Candidatus Ecksteinia adelgidicola]|nr:Peptidyl-prolyl cis-trans isomerase D [Candidatus Ecksteinia adelgidicola]
MINNMRTAVNHIMFKMILVLIILSLMLTGIGNYLINIDRNYIVKVNGQSIKKTEIERLFFIEDQYINKQLNNQNLSLIEQKEYIKKMHQRVLTQLINDILLNQYAKKLGISISNDQIKNEIRNQPYFKINNQFNNDKYLSIIHQIGYTTDYFAKIVRQQLMNRQLITVFGNSDFVLPYEYHTISSLMLQHRYVQLATININQLKNKQNINNNELIFYYHKNQDQFIIPEQVKISYIPIDVTLIKKKVKVYYKDVNAYYITHKNEFSYPERKNYSVIQLNTEQEALEVLNQLKKGKEFSDLAKSKSIDIISRRTGGKLGWFDSNSTFKELKDAHLTKKGQISSVIKSSSGYLVIRLNDIQFKKIQPLHEVYNLLYKKIKERKTLTEYYFLKKKVSKAAMTKNTSLDFVEKVAGIKAIYTNWFSFDNIPSALNFKPIIKTIFDELLIKKDALSYKNSDIITISNTRAFVIRIIDKKKASIKSFDKVKSDIINQVKYNKAINQARLQGQQLLSLLKKGKGNKAMTLANLHFGAVQKITRYSEDYSLVTTIFSLPQLINKMPIYAISQDVNNNVVLIKLISIQSDHLSDDKIKNFIEKIKENSTNISLSFLLNSLNKHAKITFNNIKNNKI